MKMPKTQTLHESAQRNIFRHSYLLRAKITGRYLHVARDLDPGRLLGTVKTQLINAFFVHWICEAALCFAGTIEHVIDGLVGRECILAGSFDKFYGNYTSGLYQIKDLPIVLTFLRSYVILLLPALIKFVLLNSSKGCSNNR